MKGIVEEIASKYFHSYRPSGTDNFLCTCPFHKEGRERRPSFWFSHENGRFLCFTCGEKGGLVRLCRLLRVSAHLRAQAEEFAHGAAREDYTKRVRRLSSGRRAPKPPSLLSEAILGVYDGPLPAEADMEHFSPEFLEAEDVGFDRAQQRVTFPVRDYLGNLAAIIGRSIEPDPYSKYKVYDLSDLPEAPGGYTPESHRHLFNFHCVYGPGPGRETRPVIIVEGPKDALWMKFSGYTSTVAGLGTSLSDDQLMMLSWIGGPYYLMYDRGGPGFEATVRAVNSLKRFGQVFVCTLPEDTPRGDPEELAEHLIQETLDKAEHQRRFLTRNREEVNRMRRRSFNSARKTINRSSGGKRRGYFKIESGETVKIRVFPGMYYDDEDESDPDRKHKLDLDGVFIYQTHYNPAKKRVEICSASHCNPDEVVEGNEEPDFIFPEFGGQCVVCYDAENNESAWQTARTQVALTFYDYREYHLSGGAGKRERIPCTGRRCRPCREKKEVFKAGLIPHGLSARFWQSMWNAHQKISDMCATCGGEIYPTQILCGVEGCGAVFMDQEAVEDTTPEDLLDFMDQEQGCQQCGEHGFPVELIACTGEGCTAPKRAKLSDIDLEVTRTGTEKDTSYSIDTRFGISEFDDSLLEEDDVVPLDYGTLDDYTPSSLKDQAKSCGIANPFEEAPRRINYARRGGR